MTLSDLHSLATVLVFVAFLGICWWAFSPRRKKRFEEAAKLPFSDEELHRKTKTKQESQSRDS